MIQRQRLRRIFFLALPIMAGMVSLNLLTLIDTIMVGRLGTNALAAIGLGSFATNVSIALVYGIPAGVQAITARLMGSGKPEETGAILNTGLVLALLLGLVMTSVCLWLAPHVFAWLTTDEMVRQEGIPYYRALMINTTALGLTYAFEGFWNGSNRSYMVMVSMVVSHLANIFFNYVLIFGKFGFPELGTAGAGVGSALAGALGATIHLLLGWRFARNVGYLRSRPNWQIMGRILRLALPSGMQQFFFAGGYLVFYWMVAKVGVLELAVTNVLVRLIYLLLLPAMGLGMAAATLVGESLGRRQPEEAARWGWDVCLVGVLVVSLLGLPMVLVPEWVLGQFLDDSRAIEMAVLPARLVGLTTGVTGIGFILTNALIGAGDNKRVMVASFSLQWFLFLPAVWFVGPVGGFGLLGVWIVQIIYGLCLPLSFVVLWLGEHWKTRQV